MLPDIKHIVIIDVFYIQPENVPFQLGAFKLWTNSCDMTSRRKEKNKTITLHFSI